MRCAGEEDRWQRGSNVEDRLERRETRNRKALRVQWIRAQMRDNEGQTQRRADRDVLEAI